MISKKITAIKRRDELFVEFYAPTQEICQIIKTIRNLPVSSSCTMQVLNRFFNLDDFLEQESANKGIPPDGNRVIIIDTRDFQEEAIKTLQEQPPKFAGKILERTTVFFIKSGEQPVNILGPPQESTVTIEEENPLVIELSSDDDSVKRLLQDLKERPPTLPLIIRHCHTLSTKDQDDIRAMILAELRSFDEKQIQFHHGFSKKEIQEIQELLNPTESSTDTTEQLFINSETIQQLQKGIKISNARWEITNGLLSDLNTTEIVITETLSNQDWLLLLNEVSIKKRKELSSH